MFKFEAVFILRPCQIFFRSSERPWREEESDGGVIKEGQTKTERGSPLTRPEHRFIYPPAVRSAGDLSNQQSAFNGRPGESDGGGTVGLQVPSQLHYVETESLWVCVWIQDRVF